MIIKDTKRLKAIIKRLKKENKKIVFTNGCFDLTHIGHAKFLKFARRQGDTLIVAVNTDSSVRKIKGKCRPIINEKYRMEMVDSIKGVDYVIPMKELTPKKIIKIVKPDVFVKGPDYKDITKMPEYHTLLKIGSKIIIYNKEILRSTKIINKILRCYSK